MGWRFRKSIRIMPGVRLNFGKRGVSTTIGPRGASVNVGRRGVYVNAGIPGTGLSYRERIGGNSSVQSGATAAGSRSVGCIAVGLLGGLLVAIIGALAGTFESPSPDAGPERSYTQRDGTSVIRQEAAAAEAFHVSGVMNVRSAPDRYAPIVRQTSRGDTVRLGPEDANGWAPLYSRGNREGYLYRASNLVRSAAPSVQTTTRRTHEQSPRRPQLLKQK